MLNLIDHSDPKVVQNAILFSMKVTEEANRKMDTVLFFSDPAAFLKGVSEGKSMLYFSNMIGYTQDLYKGK